MMPGPQLFYKCPHCGNYLTNSSLRSGNTIDATVYSDGRMFALMLPEFPDLTKCKECENYLWLSKLQSIEYPLSDLDFTFQNINLAKFSIQDINNAEFLSIDEYINALELNLAENNEDEYYIRNKILWGFNDRLRKSEAHFNSDSDIKNWESNIERLLLILDIEVIEQKLLIAELNRNLGNFETCLKIIETIEESQFDKIKNAFRLECAKKNKILFQF